MNELAYFAGAGGGLLGSHIAGIRTVCAVERDAYAASVLAQRQTDGCLSLFPIWSDAESFDARKWRGYIDLVSGGFPCQDISVAGKGAGITGKKSGAWSFMRDCIRIIEPEWVWLENSPILVSRGLNTVLRDLAEIGYDAEWDVFGACHIGASHRRDRIWILAHARCFSIENVADPLFPGLERFTRDEHQRNQSRRNLSEQNGPISPSRLCHKERSDWWASEPELGRVANGVAHRMDRIKAIGNGQVPAVAAFAFRTLLNRIK